jgi:hypothetical protein
VDLAQHGGKEIPFVQGHKDHATGVAQIYFGDFVLGVGQTGGKGKDWIQHTHTDLDPALASGV